MTRRYGWRAVLKAMKIEGMDKGSEVEIKVLPVNTLSKAKQVKHLELFTNHAPTHESGQERF